MNRHGIGRTVAVFLAAQGFLACRSSGEQESRADAARLSHAIDAVRNAPNDAKHETLDALKAIGCNEDERCALKKVCVEAYESHARAVDVIASAREDLEKSGAVMTNSALALLAGAQKIWRTARSSPNSAPTHRGRWCGRKDSEDCHPASGLDSAARRIDGADLAAE